MVSSGDASDEVAAVLVENMEVQVFGEVDCHSARALVCVFEYWRACVCA